MSSDSHLMLTQVHVQVPLFCQIGNKIPFALTNDETRLNLHTKRFK